MTINAITKARRIEVILEAKEGNNFPVEIWSPIMFI